MLTTHRITLRRFRDDDVANLTELDSDPAVMRFLTGGKPTPEREVRERLIPKILADYECFEGLGRWAAEDRATGAFIGWFALTPHNDDIGDLELGYRLRRAFWGGGYATEGSQALVDLAFTHRRAQRVFAETMAVNKASRRVMEKAGLRYMRTFHIEFDDPIPGTEHGEVAYELTRDQWKKRRASTR